MAIIPESMIDPKSQKLNWWLRSISILSWHVKVINEADGLNVRVLWLEFVVGSLIEVALNNFLASLGGGTSREVDSE